MMAQALGGGSAIRAAKDELRKKLKKALSALTEEQKIEQSKHLVGMVSLHNWIARVCSSTVC